MNTRERGSRRGRIPTSRDTFIVLFAMRLAHARYPRVTTPVYIYLDGKARGKREDLGFRIQESEGPGLGPRG
jgi:hypothetical protein